MERCIDLAGLADDFDCAYSAVYGMVGATRYVHGRIAYVCMENEAISMREK